MRRMNYNNYQPSEVVDLPPSTLNDIQTGLDLDDDWEKFAEKAGFTSTEIQSLEFNSRNSNRGPSRLLFNHWYTKCPSVRELARILLELGREEDLRRIRNYLDEDAREHIEMALNLRRQGTPDSVGPCSRPQAETSGPDIFHQLSEPSNSRPLVRAGNRNSAPPYTGPHHRQEPPSTSQSNRLETLLSMTTCEFQIDEIQAAMENSLLIGQSGFSQVHQVTLRGQTRAIKKIKDKLSQPSDHLRNEIQSLIRYRHPHIVSLLGFCRGDVSGAEPIVYLVYPLITRGSLYLWIHEHTQHNLPLLTAVQRIEILLRVAEGLALLHSDKPVPGYHGDIASSNVLIDSKRQSYLCDFGASGHEGHSTENKAISVLTATPGYISGDMKAGPTSDVYSFGVLCAETWLNRSVDGLVDAMRSERKEPLEPALPYPGWNPHTDTHMTKLVLECTNPIAQRIKINQAIKELTEIIRAENRAENYEQHLEQQRIMAQLNGPPPPYQLPSNDPSTLQNTKEPL